MHNIIIQYGSGDEYQDDYQEGGQGDENQGYGYPEPEEQPLESSENPQEEPQAGPSQQPPEPPRQPPAGQPYGDEMARRKKKKRNIMIIAAIVIIALAAGFATMLFVARQPGTGPGNTTAHGPLKLVSTEQQALIIAKASFGYFPELVAQTQATDNGTHWLVEVRIPGSPVMTKVINPFTKKVYTVMGDIYAAPVDTVEKVVDVAKYNGKLINASGITQDAGMWVFTYMNKTFGVIRTNGRMVVIE